VLTTPPLPRIRTPHCYPDFSDYPASAADTFLGAAQWSVWEVVFMRLWASGTLPYVTDASALSLLSSPATVAKMLFWVAAVPVFREFHFYWVRSEAKA
jgi:hypothetical protein